MARGVFNAQGKAVVSAVVSQLGRTRKQTLQSNIAATRYSLDSYLRVHGELQVELGFRL